MSIIDRPREDDERDLHMLRMRDRGFTARQCGAPYGIRPEMVRAFFQRLDRDVAKHEQQNEIENDPAGNPTRHVAGGVDRAARRVGVRD